MPSSFTRVLSRALVFSTRPPVSVWSTVAHDLKLRGFSWKPGINHFVSVETRHHASALPPRICLRRLPTRLNRTPSAGWPSLLRPPHRSHARCRNINRLPIDYASRPRLRGRLTLRRLTLRRKPWAFGEGDSHPLCRYSCQHSHFRYLQQTLQSTFNGLRNAPLPCQSPGIRSFGMQL